MHISLFIARIYSYSCIPLHLFSVPGKQIMDDFGSGYDYNSRGSDLAWLITRPMETCYHPTGLVFDAYRYTYLYVIFLDVCSGPLIVVATACCCSVMCHGIPVFGISHNTRNSWKNIPIDTTRMVFGVWCVFVVLCFVFCSSLLLLLPWLFLLSLLLYTGGCCYFCYLGYSLQHSVAVQYIYTGLRPAYLDTYPDIISISTQGGLRRATERSSLRATTLQQS